MQTKAKELNYQIDDYQKSQRIRQKKLKTKQQIERKNSHRLTKILKVFLRLELMPRISQVKLVT